MAPRTGTLRTSQLINIPVTNRNKDVLPQGKDKYTIIQTTERYSLMNTRALPSPEEAPSAKGQS